MSKFIQWTIIAGAWILFICGVLYFVEGASRGSAGWIGLGAAVFLYFAWVTFNKLDHLQRRVVRLEVELGKHQRWHGHMTEFKE